MQIKDCSQQSDLSLLLHICLKVMHYPQNTKYIHYTNTVNTVQAIFRPQVSTIGVNDRQPTLGRVTSARATLLCELNLILALTWRCRGKV